MKKFLLLLVIIIATGCLYFVVNIRNQSGSDQTSATGTDKANGPDTNPLKADRGDTSQSFDKSLFSITDPSSQWFIVNKHYPLPLEYSADTLVVPSVPLRLAASEQQMRISKVAVDNLNKLFTASQQAGVKLEFGSGYRSSVLQRQFYDAYVVQDGQAAADTYSARPGHSEHQTGLSLDFTRPDKNCHLEECFGDLPEGVWLKENASKYGFILRYPKNKQQVTGYIYEPWHYRYVGVELATDMQLNDFITLEEYFGLEPAPDYIN